MIQRCFFLGSIKYILIWIALGPNSHFSCRKSALLYLQSDSTTVPLADAKLRGPRDAFKKGLQKVFILNLLKRDDIIRFPAEKSLFNVSGPRCKFESSHQRANRKLSKADSWFIKRLWSLINSGPFTVKKHNKAFILSEKNIQLFTLWHLRGFLTIYFCWAKQIQHHLTTKFWNWTIKWPKTYWRWLIWNWISWLSGWFLCFNMSFIIIRKTKRMKSF